MITWANLDLRGALGRRRRCRKARGSTRLSAPRAAARRVRVPAAFEPVEIEIFAPAAVDPARSSSPNVVDARRHAPRLRPRVGRADAKAANDRRFALALHERLGVAAARRARDRIGRRARRAPRESASALGLQGAVDRRGSRSRARRRPRGPAKLASYVSRLLDAVRRARLRAVARSHPRLGVVRASRCATAASTCTRRTRCSPTRAVGSWGSISRRRRSRPRTNHGSMRIVDAAGAALARAGYAGPFTVDAFVYRAIPRDRRRHVRDEVRRRLLSPFVTATHLRSRGRPRPSPPRSHATTARHATDRLHDRREAACSTRRARSTRATRSAMSRARSPIASARSVLGFGAPPPARRARRGAATSLVTGVSRDRELRDRRDARHRVARPVQPPALAVIARERLLGIDRRDHDLAAAGQEQHRLEAFGGRLRELHRDAGRRRRFDHRAQRCGLGDERRDPPRAVLVVDEVGLRRRQASSLVIAGLSAPSTLDRDRQARRNRDVLRRRLILPLLGLPSLLAREHPTSTRRDQEPGAHTDDSTIGYRRAMDSGDRCLQGRALASGGNVLALTGAGVSAESGIPTFRGKEGYWTVGAREYHPQELATPRGVHAHAVGRVGLVPLPARRVPRGRAERRATSARALGPRARRSVRADHPERRRSASPRRQPAARTYPIHGDIDLMRCAADCMLDRWPIPDECPRARQGRPVTATVQALPSLPALRRRWRARTCCGSTSRTTSRDSSSTPRGGSRAGDAAHRRRDVGPDEPAVAGRHARGARTAPRSSTSTSRTTRSGDRRAVGRRIRAPAAVDACRRSSTRWTI